MNKENLKRGQELSEKIEKLELQLKTLELSNGIYDGQIALCNGNGTCVGKVNSFWIDFEVLKVLAINKITKKLNEYKQEFEKL